MTPRQSPPKRKGRESRADRTTRTLEILMRLKRQYPDAHCELDFANPYQLLVATILSAQCTDVRVNQVTPALFARWPDPQSLAVAKPVELEAVVRPTGFFRTKARNLIGMAQGVTADHSGQIPASMDELRSLPGVGRKTANVILGNAFGTSEGITVDTHILRLGRLLGLTHGDDAERVEEELMAIVPREDWALVSHLLIWHGRRVCIANRPRCDECVLSDLCPSAFKPSVGYKGR
ncbi:MAG TPA: endonuclease III [Gemmatimonadales bacterium]|jgi:endonuclease-3